MDKKTHLLVDGYNVIHSWPELRRKLLHNKDGGASAREHLITEVRSLHDTEGIAATLVFDGKEAQTTIQRPSPEPSFAIIYAAAEKSADGVIESIVAKSATPQNFIAVTHDLMIAESLYALGADTLTPESLKEWINRCTARQSTKLVRRRRSINAKWGQRLEIPPSSPPEASDTP